MPVRISAASQTLGATSFVRVIVISMSMDVARPAPRSELAKSQAFLPQATQRRVFSSALFDLQILPSSTSQAK